MDTKAQSALEYLMTYGWALVVIVIVIAALVFLLGSSTTTQHCSMSPAAGAISYVDHAIAADGNINLLVRNDSGKSIDVDTVTFGGDFSGSGIATDANLTSAEETILYGDTLIDTGDTYNGTVTIAYRRNSIAHVATASCTGKAA